MQVLPEETTILDKQETEKAAIRDANEVKMINETNTRMYKVKNKSEGIVIDYFIYVY